MAYWEDTGYPLTVGNHPYTDICRRFLELCTCSRSRCHPFDTAARSDKNRQILPLQTKDIKISVLKVKVAIWHYCAFRLSRGAELTWQTFVSSQRHKARIALASTVGAFGVWHFQCTLLVHTAGIAKQ